jgi:hypothetical protein
MCCLGHGLSLLRTSMLPVSELVILGCVTARWWIVWQATRNPASALMLCDMRAFLKSPLAARAAAAAAKCLQATRTPASALTLSWRQ